MTQFTLGASDVRAALGWGAHRTRTLLTGLSFVKAPAAIKGGNRTRFYRLSDVLERCWRARSFDQRMAEALIQADQRVRAKLQEPIS